MTGEKRSELDNYILNLSEKPEPRVCYIPTATGDAEEAIQRFYQSGLRGQLSHFSLFKMRSGWRDRLLQQDIIYVGGGNTRSMLAVWREWGVDSILRDCYERGIILAGMSAGAICWFSHLITDSDPEHFSVIKGLDILPGMAAAHFDDETNKRKLFINFADSNPQIPCYGIDDYAGLHFVNERLRNTIRSREKAGITVRNVGHSIEKTLANESNECIYSGV
ncbi:peptidase E [Veronia pacifica]|uniref:Peptidase E n=1 Tax=Veronia pacifica TaxID=1080227 RepID=A0A1C3EPX8_9GAMM|nr:peptidase E [Veronia pacifica]ODA35242.1 peptidase E [Veronia pacifica]